MYESNNSLAAEGPTPTSRRYAALCVAAAALLAGLVASVGANGETGDPAAVERYKAVYRRPAAIPYPDDNARTPERERLGRTLFFDPRLSASRSISCATCHDPDLAWSDGLPRAIGHGKKQLDRRTPTIANLAWAPALFWDGRADSLEEQALGPIQAPGEMNLSLADLVSRLEAIDGYRSLFAGAYPGEPVSPGTVAKAIATFERGVVSGRAPFDRWMDGDKAALPTAAQRGFVLFNEKARCSVCHTGWRFSDDGFYDIGVTTSDRGRGRITPDLELTQFAFKTPTLRDVATRAPYMHNGSVATLEEVIDLYDRGGVAKRPSLSPEVKPLGLTGEETRDLVAFLQSLTSAVDEPTIPVLPR